MLKLQLAQGEPRFTARGASGATEAHLEAINALPSTLNPVTAADVYVRECLAINDAPLKNGLRVDASAVVAMVPLCIGKGIQCNHDTYNGKAALPVGRIFAAESQTIGSTTWARMLFYIPNTPEGAELVERIDSGVIAEASVSFGYDEVRCSICATDLSQCAHWPGETYDGKTCEGLILGPTEFYELSLVWQGCANGTRFRMAAGAGEADLREMFTHKPAPGSLAEVFARRPPPFTWEQFFTPSHGSPAP